MVFDSVPAATAAMRAMNDFPFYDKPMRVSYARTKSDATAKLDGTFDPSARDPEVRAKRKAESQQQEREARAKKAENEKQGRGGAGAAASADPDAPPNEILFVQGLPGTERLPRRFLFLPRASGASKAFEARASVGSAFFLRFSPGSAGNGTRPSDDAPQPIKLSDPRGDDTHNQGHFEDGETVFGAWLGRHRGGIFVSSSGYPSRRLTPPPLRAVTHPPRLVRVTLI